MTLEQENEALKRVIKNLERQLTATQKENAALRAHEEGSMLAWLRFKQREWG